MKIYNSIEAFEKIENAVVTTGTFDGVHKGHLVVIEQLKKYARKIGGETVLLTFFPHPRMVLYPDDNDLRLINTVEEKAALLEAAGIDHLIIHPFSKEFSRISSLEFVRNILVNQIGVHTLIIGYDHHFGRNREGSFEHLKEFSSLYGFDVEEIPAQEVQQVNVSSTKIRKSLMAGEINAANQFLGHPYALSGKVVKGKQVGREINFPTANIEVKEWFKLIPANGVYAVKVVFEKQTYKGMLNIGSRPTLKGKTSTIEVNIFDFKQDIYDEELTIVFYDRIRSEQDFGSLAALKKQLHIDKKNVIQIFE